MNEYCVSYSILGNVFTISTNSFELLFNQISHIAQFCYSIPSFKTHNKHPWILIEYFEEQTMFEEYKELIISSDFKTITTFENEYHAETTINFQTYFMQLPDKYIVRKVSNYHYIVIGDGIRNTTKYVFRLIREIIVRIQENNGKLFMHATSLVASSYGISIIGNAGSGKTTYFSKLLSMGECSIISNDRTFLYVDKQIKMDYFPIPVVYKLGAVQHNNYLKKYILDSKKYTLPQSFKEGFKSFPIPLTDVVNFFPNTTFKETSILNMVIISEIDFENPYCFESQLLSREEAIKVMSETCFTPIDFESFRKPWLYTRNKNDSILKIESEKIIEQIVSSIPIYFVRFGKDISYDEIYSKTICLMEEAK